MQFEIESAGVADRFALVVATPECRGRRVTVGAGEACPTVIGHLLVRTDRRPMHTVHLGVEAARVAQVVAGAVAPPQRSRYCATVDALSGLAGEEVTLGCNGQCNRINWSVLGLTNGISCLACGTDYTAADPRHLAYSTMHSGTVDWDRDHLSIGIGI